MLTPLTYFCLLQGVSARVCQCLQHKYRGNGYLEEGKVSQAIEEYRRALEVGVESQRGILLLQRANAYLRRASQHRDSLRQIVQELVKSVPDPGTLRAVYEEASDQPLLALSLFRSVLEKTSAQKSQFRKTQYRHGLYQHALLKASQDALEATSLLPNYGTAFYRTGEILSELWKVKESLQYYDRAVVLDPSLAPKVRSVTDRLRRREELLESARAYGWTDNALRLALDVS
jgi:tetratricopeptide (TPR) repeat protein